MVGTMISKPELKRVVRHAIPRPHGSRSIIELDPSSVKTLKHLRVVTEAWKRMPRTERVGKVIDALYAQVPVKDREHIISVGVFTREEWNDRMAFARKLNRITGSAGKPKAVAKKQSTRKSSSYVSKAASKLRTASRKKAH